MHGVWWGRHFDFNEGISFCIQVPEEIVNKQLVSERRTFIERIKTINQSKQKRKCNFISKLILNSLNLLLWCLQFKNVWWLLSDGWLRIQCLKRIHQWSRIASQYRKCFCLFLDHICWWMHGSRRQMLACSPLRLLWVRRAARGSEIRDERRQAILLSLLREAILRVLWHVRGTDWSRSGSNVTRWTTLAR